MKKTTSRNFHLPLSDDLYTRLRKEAERSQQSATFIAREALEQGLAERERSALHEAIAAYASDAAGSREDLDPDLEAASLQILSEQEETRP